MKKNEVLKLVKIIFYGLAIVSLALSILGKVYAEGMSSSDISKIESYYRDKSFYNSISSFMQTIYANCPYYSMAYDPNTGYIKIAFFPKENMYVEGIQNNWKIESNTLWDLLCYNDSYSVFSINGYSNAFCAILFIQSDSSYSLIVKRDNSLSTWNISVPVKEYYGTSSSSIIEYVNKFSRNNNGNSNLLSGTLLDINQPFQSSIQVFGNGKVGYYNVDADTCFYYPIQVGPEYSNDSRLKIGSIVHNGRNELYIDMSDFLEDSLASSYNVSDLVLSVDFDGNVVTFDNLDSYIDIYSTDSGYDCIAFFPYTFFGFSDDNTISDISVQLTQVSFSVSALYPNRPIVSEDYYISTSYYLKNDLDNNVDWDNTNVPEQNNDVIQYDDDNFNDLKDSLYSPDNQQHGTIYNKWHFTDSLPVWEGWETIYNVEVFTFNDTLGAEHTWYRVEQSFGDNVVQFGLSYYIPFRISDWLYDNAISNYYDVLVFENFNGKYEDVNITSPDGYLIFYSDRYFIKKNTLEIGNVHKTLTSVGNQVYTLYDITYKRLTDINGNIQKGFESVLSKDSAILSLLGTVNFNLDRFGNMLNNNLGKIVTGVNGLYGSDDRDFTDIYNKLGTLVSNVDLSNTLNTLFVPTYTGFDDTFNSAIDSMGILALPFEVSKDFISAAKVEYQPTFRLTVPGFEHEGLIYWNEYNFELDPLSFLSADWLEFLQYCNALFVIFSVTLLTYKHIFASPVSEESGVL